MKRLPTVAKLMLALSGPVWGVLPVAAADWVDGDGFRSVELAVPSIGKPGFTRLEPESIGVGFVNRLSDRTASENQIRLLGSGVALGDVDGDGWCDVYFSRLEGSNALYRNLGEWRFEEITDRAGVACAGQFSTGCVFGDVDGDGDLDLLVNSLGGGTRCFINDGEARFSERVDSGLMKERSGTSLALADLDGDGDLDLYVANYRTTTIRSTGLTVLEIDGKRVLRPEDRDQYEFTPEGMILEHGEVDLLYINDGTGRFEAVPWRGGRFLDESGQPLAAEPNDWSLSVLMRDFDGDGAPDVYVCGDFWSPDRVWMNDGRGTFRALPALAMRNTSTFSMGVDASDIDRDGDDDLFVLDMKSRSHERRMKQLIMAAQNVSVAGQEARFQVERNTLQMNRGDGTFAEIAQLAGLDGSDWSWGVAFVDVDLDGFEDVLITTGHGFDTQDIDTEERIARMGPVSADKLHTKLLMYPRLNAANVAFRNRGDLTFEEAGAVWGFEEVGVSHGMALADLDGDGDQDVVVNNLNREASFYRNESAAPRVAVRVRGKGLNTGAIGARLRFFGNGRPQRQEIVAGGRYLSGDQPERVFAAGGRSGSLRIEVTWRGGGRTMIRDVQANRRYEIIEPPAAAEVERADQEEVTPLFREVEGFHHVHHEEPFNDYARQNWLPRQLSHGGPAVVWCDVDHDGWEDLIIGSGRGGSLEIYHNRGNSRFDHVAVGSLMGPAGDDLTGIVAWPDASGATSLLVAQANYETGPSDLPAAARYALRMEGMTLAEQLPAFPGSVGPMALGDVDADGDLDLFVGGRVAGGRYPEATASRLFLSVSNKFELAHEWPAMGLVSGAVFSDVTGDGWSDLIVACEWGSLRLLENRRGTFVDVSDEAGLGDYPGWWNGVTTGDFDGDGRLDIVASNWGRNHPYRGFQKEGIVLVYGELAQSGVVEGVEAYREGPGRPLVPWRDLDVLGRALPWLRSQFPTHAAFGRATLEQIVGERAARRVMVNWLDSTLFLNRGGKFEARSLPVEAQLTPAFGVSVGDCDGDGREDLFLSQNFSRMEPERSRAEAGRGLWLLGDGAGGFRPLPARESGVDLQGDQRGSAVSDFDGDGRLDLVVTQNAGPTRLYRNARARRGLRVRLESEGGKVPGVGSVVRLEQGGRVGPAREIHAGSGYWSQDGSVQVLAWLADETEGGVLAVRWPGGKALRVEVPAGAREVTIGPNGLERSR